jgi:ABC-type transporter Mla maintaining outer membrane lipid asymmetry ATPase subunit MlaF
VLLYDEPTAGLDPIASTVVEDLIRSVHIKGRDALGKPGNITSYVVVTHQHSTIKRAIDRYGYFHDGGKSSIPNPLNLFPIYVPYFEKHFFHGCRLLFLHKGKLVWEGMTHEFTTSTNPIVQQVCMASSVTDNIMSCFRILLFLNFNFLTAIRKFKMLKSSH